MATATTAPTSTVEVDSLEELAILRCQGAKFAGAEMAGSRVSAKFQATAKQRAALEEFRRNVGPQVCAPEFAAALVWSKDIVFRTRRNSGADRGYLR